jgi:hypothetical protein
MGNRQNLPHHRTLKIKPTITNKNQFTEKLLLNRHNLTFAVLLSKSAKSNLTQTSQKFTETLRHLTPGSGSAKVVRFV